MLSMRPKSVAAIAVALALLTAAPAVAAPR
jgi:hypothetical protein